jgi:hypothetical protein
MTHPSGVSSGNLQRFSKVATINDEEGFLLVLEQLLAERLASHAARNVSPDIVALAQAMQAPVPHQPTAAQLQRGKVLQLAELRRKTNVPIARFAARWEAAPAAVQGDFRQKASGLVRWLASAPCARLAARAGRPCADPGSAGKGS